MDQKENVFFEKEQILQKDVRKMKDFYPQNAAVIQSYVEDTCDRMDYEGSRMYDEYPDKYMLLKVCDSIYNRIQKDGERLGVESGYCKNCANMPKEALKDLIEVLFYNEMGRRREGRRRCRKCGL